MTVAMEDLEGRTIRKVSARLIPFLIMCYFIADLDRVNVAFAAIKTPSALDLPSIMRWAGSRITLAVLTEAGC